MPMIQLRPNEVLTGTEVGIQISGFKGHSEVLLTSSRIYSAKYYQSTARFRANANGIIHIKEDSPISGSYLKADSWGPFWSMEEIESESTPRNQKPDYVYFYCESNDGLNAEATLKLISIAPEITRSEVRDDGLVGVCFLPNGEGPFPAVIIVGGSGGGLSESAAAYWASQGYVALALAYFALGNLPPYLKEIPLEYFGKAIQWLQNRGIVDAKKIGIIGVSRGGELALLLASYYPEIKAVLARTPSHVCWGAVVPESEKHLAGAWTWNGRVIPYVHYLSSKCEYKPIGENEKAVFSVPAFNASLEQFSEQISDAEIPIERIKAPILFIAGLDDQIWPASFFIERARERLIRYNHSYPNEFLIYENAGHVFSFPGDPAPEPYFFHPITKEWIALGGSREGCARAGLDSLIKAKRFLREHLMEG